MLSLAMVTSMFAMDNIGNDVRDNIGNQEAMHMNMQKNASDMMSQKNELRNERKIETFDEKKAKALDMLSKRVQFMDERVVKMKTTITCIQKSTNNEELKTCREKDMMRPGMMRDRMMGQNQGMMRDQGMNKGMNHEGMNHEMIKDNSNSKAEPLF